MAEKSPDAYRTISEAAEEADLPAHVLRFWESKFSQLKPIKRNGGRRLYRPQDVQLLKGLRRLLYEEGFTIKGAQKYLRDHGVASVAELGAGEGGVQPEAPRPAEPESEGEERTPSRGEGAPGLSAKERKSLEAVLGRLERARARLEDALNS
ncbi:MerR family transcriptional regulator [Marinicauda algicola]|uniref:MerR family transcriptional regulator n=1 Tax=Marinicauda algicola TaxID=2029849 RepID=A0A4S2GXU1_9PROT|nr:MerR family transcriptional regulator [Marinicauda algicola]TGY87873.1 MerR family transcriptional regulator [Marinicauda algicola]